MILTKEQLQSFEQAAKPLMQWLCENCHPHVSVHVDPTSAQLSEGTATVRTHEFVKD